VRRAERQHALVDVLRATAPRPRSVTWLAQEFAVSTRTVERDIRALQQAGVPIYGEVGRTGGYAIRRDYSLPPLQFSGAEALAVLAGLTAMLGSPFGPSARTASAKVVAALPADTRDTAQALLDGMYVMDADGPTGSELRDRLATALLERRVIEIDYRDDRGTRTHRQVEPLGLLLVRGNWVVLAWCRLRDGVRGFRTDWITSCSVTDEVAPLRDPAHLQADLQRWSVTQSPLTR